MSSKEQRLRKTLLFSLYLFNEEKEERKENKEEELISLILFQKLKDLNGCRYTTLEQFIEDEVDLDLFNLKSKNNSSKQGHFSIWKHYKYLEPEFKTRIENAFYSKIEVLKDIFSQSELNIIEQKIQLMKVNSSIEITWF
jgi:hypothetical protein